MQSKSTPEYKPKTPGNALKLNPKLIKAWESSVLELARKPKGENFAAMSPQQQMSAIMRAERGNVQALWQVFNQERTKLTRYLQDPKKGTVAYLLGFHLANCARMELLLGRLEERHNFSRLIRSNNRDLKIFDMGCGTGAASLSLHSHLIERSFAKEKISVELIDRQKAFLNAAHENYAKFEINPAQISTQLKSAEDYIANYRPNAQDAKAVKVLTFSYFLNELIRSETSPRQVLRFCKNFLREEGPTVILILDSANNAVSRFIMEFRDHLVEAGYRPLYPCPTPTPCPMLKRSRDWCFSEGYWEEPPLQRKMDELIEVDHRKFNSTLFALASPSFLKNKAIPKEEVIVGRPVTRWQRGRDPQVSYLLCNGTKLIKKKPKGPQKSRGLLY